MHVILLYILWITFSTLLVILLYKRSLRNYDYWKKKGVPFVKPKPIVGNFLNIFTLRTNIGGYLANLYKLHNNEPYLGLFSLQTPILVVHSPELMKSILTTNFKSFPNRNYLYDPEIDMMSTGILQFLKQPEWKQTRQKMTSVFTLAKLKNMAQLMDNVAFSMTAYIDENLKLGPIDGKAVSSKFATDVTAACIFEIESNSFKNDNDDFNLIGKRIFNFSWKSALVQNCYILAPSVIKMFKLKFFNKEIRDFTRNVFWEILNRRNNTKTSRHSLIDIINEMRVIEGNQESDMDRYVAQAVTFYAAGSSEPASALSFALYELCMNPEIQEKARKEVNAFFDEYELNYTNLQHLRYLEMIIYETLRKYPALPYIDRISTNDFIIPNTNIVIEKGTPVFFSLLGIQRDAQYYENPEVFDPERFKDTTSKEGLCYLPFGTGLRTCLGAKFAIIELKIALARILDRFRLQKAASTPERVEFSENSFLLTAKHELNMDFVNIV